MWKSAEILKSLKNKTIVDVLILNNKTPEVNKNKLLDYHSENILLKLNTGKILNIWNSEWGGIELYTNIKTYLEKQ